MFTKYLTKIISSDKLLLLQDMETHSLEKREEINEEINDAMLAALVGQMCWL